MSQEEHFSTGILDGAGLVGARTFWDTTAGLFIIYPPPWSPGRMHALTTSEVDVRFIADFDHLVVQLNRTELVQQLVLAIHGRDRVTK